MAVPSMNSPNFVKLCLWVYVKYSCANEINQLADNLVRSATKVAINHFYDNRWILFNGAEIISDPCEYVSMDFTICP